MKSGNSCIRCATSLHLKIPSGRPAFVSNAQQCIIPPVDVWEDSPLQIKPLRGTMPEIKEDDSASRIATYFVFIFLIAAIIETLLASFGG